MALYHISMYLYDSCILEFPSLFFLRRSHRYTGSDIWGVEPNNFLNVSVPILFVYY